MFTGIIEEKGELISRKNTKSGEIFTIKTKNILKNKKIGQSIAVNGVCVTVTKISGKNFSFSVIPETLDLTNLAFSKKGDRTNLESSMKLKDGLDGHLVQGHVDTTGEILSLKKSEKRTVLKIKFPESISQYLALKGSITINGVSLTISDLEENNFSVDLIPHTLKMTNLGELNTGDKVNLETDLIARYLERLMDNKEKETKYSFLKDRNLI